MLLDLTCPTHVKAKRNEMTFGYLTTFIKSDLVPDMSGSIAFYSEEEVKQLMTEMDRGFTGLRRSTIDLTESVRQLILYTALTKFDDDGVFNIAVYQRANGATSELVGKYSFGFGGHVEVEDLTTHLLGGMSSYGSTMVSGEREFLEECSLHCPESLNRIEVVITPAGFISDVKPAYSGHVGNTHLGVIGIVVTNSKAEFSSKEETYTTIGWMTKEEILSQVDLFEPWSKMLAAQLDVLEDKAAAIAVATCN